MQNNKKKKARIRRNPALQSMENAIELVTFFANNPAKQILEDLEAFKFWQIVFLGKEELNDSESRRELQHINDLLTGLNAVASKFTVKQIERTLSDLQRVEVIYDKFEEELPHEN